MRVVITGGLGFVGSALLQQIHSHRDLDIVVIDNKMTNPDMRMFSAMLPNITLLVYDIGNIWAVQQALKDADVVIHLAGIVGFPACDIDKRLSYDVNVLSTDSLLKLMRRNQRIIFVSSASAYGRKPGSLVTEESKLEPLTSYGVHKKIGEILVQRSGLQHIIFRPVTAFGVSKQIRIDVLPNTLSYEALTKGKVEVFEPQVIRPFIHVQDYASALAYAMYDHMPWNTIYNVGNADLTMSKGDLAHIIGSLANKEVVLRDGSDPDRRDYALSYDRLYDTGFRPHFGIVQGFREIQMNLTRIKKDPERYTTPGNVRRFLNGV